jgi:hypothetical protein
MPCYHFLRSLSPEVFQGITWGGSWGRAHILVPSSSEGVTEGKATFSHPIHLYGWTFQNKMEDPAGVAHWIFMCLRASPAVLSMWHCTVKLDEEKSKYAGLDQEIGFGSA